MLEFLALLAVAVIDVSYMVVLASVNLPADRPAVKKLPKVSVIIAAKGGTAVERTLKALKKVRRPKMEIIVVTSSEETARIARRYAKKVVRDRGAGKGPALNAAVRKASCEILYFMDEDMTLERGTIAKVCSALDGHEVAVGFNVPSNKSGFARVARLYVSMLNRMQFGLYRLIGTTIVGGRNFAIYRKTLKGAGGFMNALTEDLELSFRLFMRRKRVKFVSARGFEQVPERLSWYFRQQQRWNAGAGHVLKEWEKRFHHHDLALLSFLVLMALVAPLSLIFLLLGIAFGSWLLLSVTALGFLICLSSAVRLGADDAALLPLTFPVFMVVQSASLAYSAISKPNSWYRTPKRQPIADLNNFKSLPYNA